MKKLPILCAIFASLGIAGLHATTASLETIYQPLHPMKDGIVAVVREVPYVTSGAIPEVWFDNITRPHIPQQDRSLPTGDINVASLAGLRLSADPVVAGDKSKLYLTWDFSHADPKQLSEDLVKVLIQCVEKTAGKSIVLYSKFVGFEKYPEYQKLVEARFPQQTPEQLKEDSGKH